MKVGSRQEFDFCIKKYSKLTIDMALELGNTYSEDILECVHNGLDFDIVHDDDIQHMALRIIFKAIRIPMQSLFLIDMHNKNKRNTVIIEKYINMMGMKLVNKSWDIPTMKLRRKTVFAGIKNNYELKEWQKYYL